MVNGPPIITRDPALNGEGVLQGTRRYRIQATDDLDGDRQEVSPEETGSHRFFRVTVEMP